jgi:metal-responsive CopG/Arc/MetJ family transcriptional regulator
VRHGFGMEKKDVRIQLVISQGEIDALDEWRARNKIWSRSEAIRQAIVRLLADSSSEEAPGKRK